MSTGGITRRVATVATGRTANVLSLVLVNAILARGWPMEQVGIALTLLVLVNSLLPLFQLGLPTSLLFFFPQRDGQGQLELTLQSMILLAASGLALSIVLYLVGTPIARFLGVADPGAIRAYLLPFLPFAFAMVAGGFADAVLVSTDRAPWMAALSVAHALVSLLVVGVAALHSRPLAELLALFSLVAAARLVAGVVLVTRALKDCQGRWRMTANGLSAYVRYAVAVGITEAIGGLSRFVDRYVVLFFFTATTFSLYQFGALEVPVGILVTAVATVLVPEVSKRYAAGSPGEVAELWKQSVRKLALIVLPLFCFLFVFSGPLFEVYLPKEYARSQWVFRIFLVALPLRCATYNALLVGMGKAVWAMWGSLVDLILNLAFSVFAVVWMLEHIPQYAFLAPAVATVLATFVQVALLIGAIGWHLPWPFLALFPWARLGGVLGLSCSAALVAWFAAAGVSAAIAKLLVGGAVFAAALAILYWLVPSTRTELKQVWTGIHVR
jgi:O-antigen/teichoic acid export membrane protein